MTITNPDMNGNSRVKALGSGNTQEVIYSVNQAILSSGASIAFMSHTTSSKDHCVAGYEDYPQRYIRCGWIILDIDGPNKGKYTYGHDVFALAITKEGLKPSNYTENRLDTDYWMEQVCWYGRASSQWIMDNNNMDYLMVDSDGKCPNGHKLGYAEGRYRSCK